MTIIAECLTIGALVFVTLCVEPGFALSALCALVILGGVSLFFMRRMYDRWAQEMHRCTTNQIATIQSSLQGFKDIKLAGKEDFFLSRYLRVRRQMSGSLVRLEFCRGWPPIGMETVFLGSIMLALIWLLLGGVSAQQFIPSVILFTYAGIRIIPAFNRVVVRYLSLRSALPALTEFQMAMDDSPESVSESLQAVLPEQIEKIELQGLEFTYPGQRAARVHSLDLTIDVGTSIAIVGTTGSGKTTLLHLIIGLLAPEKGTIRCDRIDIQSAMRSWQRKIGYVAQDSFMLPTTIQSNVTLGDADDTVDLARLNAACQAAQLNSWVESLPDGLQTKIGEYGLSISGGQRQRIAIARALYQAPQILALDEATSALDSDTEQALLRAIMGNSNLTVLMVSHRMLATLCCERVVYMEKGEIADVRTIDAGQSVICEADGTIRNRVNCNTR
jgi:ABC-type bacteriocin/lantibiotic exporter with double-glycine peptidase domain